MSELGEELKARMSKADGGGATASTSSASPKGAASAPRRSRVLSSLLLGQGISLLITGTGIFETLLVDQGVDIPAVQASINYLLLCLFLCWARPEAVTSTSIDQRPASAVVAADDALSAGQRRPRSQRWRYALWAFADVEANFLVVWAYQYTSVASVMLLDCFAIPCVMGLSRVLLGAAYTSRHVLACAVCLIGLSLTVLSDVLATQASMAPKGPAWLGDIMVLSSASLYALSNVQQEWIMKAGGSLQRPKALGMLGVWGSLFSCAQAAVLERQALGQIVWTPWLALPLVGYQLCLLGVYVLTSRFLLSSDATLFNLSMLTSDVYSVVFAWSVQRQRFSWIYVAAFATTFSGVVLYSSQKPPVAPEVDLSDCLCAGAESHSCCEAADSNCEHGPGSEDLRAALLPAAASAA